MNTDSREFWTIFHLVNFLQFLVKEINSLLNTCVTNLIESKKT